MTRRELLAAAAALSFPKLLPAATAALPVAIAKVPSYNEDLNAALATMFDQIGGLERIVKNKTVTVPLLILNSGSFISISASKLRKFLGLCRCQRITNAFSPYMKKL